MTKLAVQMFTVRDLVKDADGFARTLEAISKIGYTAVQLSAVGAMNGDEPEVDAATAKRWLDDNGLEVIATHRPWPRLVENADEEIAFHKSIGCDYVAIGGIPRDLHDKGADGYREFIAQGTPALARLKEAGLRFGYHNHAHEFKASDKPGQTCYDLFIDEADPDLWLLELDVYWCQHAGVNAERLFERLKGRVPVIHIKDKEVIDGEGPIIGPIGEGLFDWDHIIPAGNAAGVEWWAVEQDRCRRDPVDCLRASYEFLTQKGLQGRK
ncbi:MAG: sugar phosphate isomerase/epimerase [Planctomycetota bacterium]|jgi:sugar phosphate isomerase/epimerase|nr:sugar phosphate isomerase/epimerase [Planctomycetota bacterium]